MVMHWSVPVPSMVMRVLFKGNEVAPLWHDVPMTTLRLATIRYNACRHGR